MTKKRQFGAVLLDSGRITEADVERALEYQRAHGGYFGQALFALGLVSREEIDWALASHFDLPFIFPDAEAVDRDVARIVPPDWALAHMAVPIVRAGRTLTVVAADPLRSDVVDELRRRTGCEVELALATAARIRELIHAVYDAAQSERLDEEPAMTFGEFLVQSADRGAERFGISVRDTVAVGWWRSRAGTHRTALLDGWETALDEAVRPSVRGRIEGLAEGQVDWRAELYRPGATVPLEVRALLGTGGYELMFRATEHSAEAELPNVVLPASLVTELRLLWRSGSARIGFGAQERSVARRLLPLLPTLALGDHARAVHVNESGSAAGAYTLRAERNEAFADDLVAYALDAVTIDLPAEGFPLRALLQAAPLSFLILEGPEESAVPPGAGINWLLTIAGQPGSHAWDLRALHS